jgi:hypothetical protein
MHQRFRQFAETVQDGESGRDHRNIRRTNETSSLAHYRSPAPAERRTRLEICIVNRLFGACLPQPLLRLQPV